MSPQDDQQKPNGADPAGKKDEDERLRSAGLALTIPSLLIAGPAVGLLLGWWLGRLAGHKDAGLLIGLALGFAAGVREVVKILRRMSK